MASIARFYWDCAKYAWEGSFSFANNAVTLVGGLLLGAYWWFGLQVTANNIAGQVAISLAPFIMAWVIGLSFRACLAPAVIWRSQGHKLVELEAQLRSENALAEQTKALYAQVNALNLHTEELRLQRENRERESAGNPAASDRSNALTIAYGTGANHIAEQTFDNGMISRTVFVAVKNQGNGWLTNCSLEVVNVRPPPVETAPLKVIMPLFDLPVVGMEKYVPVATHYRDRVPVSKNAPKSVLNGMIGIFFSAPGTWGGGAWTLLSPEESYDITLRAKAHECKPHDAHLSVWIGEGELLQAKLIG